MHLKQAITKNTHASRIHYLSTNPRQRQLASIGKIIRVKSWPLLAMVLLGWLAGENSTFGQQLVMVNPAVTSNTYSGLITLNITGLTNKEQVTVQRWLDVNGNGVIDPGEPMIEAFKIKVGGAMVIGGVTNVSVPYDTDPATNAITTTLNFAPPLTLMDIVGQQIFRVTSPTGRFSPVTATLTVTNAPLPQSVSGVVYSNGVAGLPNAIVVAEAAPNNNYAGATVADSSGNYHLTLPPGQYSLIGLYPGYYVDESLAPFVALTNGFNATNNMSATNSTGPFIAGQIYDATNSSGIGGVFLQLTLSGGSLFAVAFADTNGDYAAPVTSNIWKIKIESSQMARRAYITPENTAATISTALGSVSNVDFGLFKANALYYGRFTDNTGVPLVNYDIVANDNSNQFKADGFTDTNGYYGVAILNTTNTPWYVSPGGDDIQLVNAIVNSPQNLISNNTTTALNNFQTLPITAQISGQLLDNTGHPISNIGISANQFITNSDSYYSTAFVDTDTNGNYSFGAASGTWYVFANAVGGHSLTSAGYYDPAPYHGVNIPPNNAVVNLIVYPANLPQFGQPVQVSASQFDFNLYGANGNNYTVQTSTNLATTNWNTLTIVSNLPSSPFLVQDFQATNGARFYRAFQGP